MAKSRAITETQAPTRHTAASVISPRASALLTPNEWQAIGNRVRLSPRELEIAQGLMDCLDEVGVACQLGISEHTVHTYLRRMYQKTGANSRCEFVIRLFAAHLENNGKAE